MDAEWSDFKVLIALSEAGSVAGAARLLGIDASTVSRRLAALEDAVGATLVIRGGREFAITADGRSVLAAAHEMADATARAGCRGSCPPVLHCGLHACPGESDADCESALPRP